MTKILPDDLLIPEVADLIRQGRSVTLTARGNSMNPFITDRRDRVVLSPFAETQLQPGAVVLAKTKDSRYVLHRILYRRGNELILSGDGNLNQTECTDTGRVIGLMTAVIRKGKTYQTDGTVWIRYSFLWKRLAPIRRWLLAIFRRTEKRKYKRIVQYENQTGIHASSDR